MLALVDRLEDGVVLEGAVRQGRRNGRVTPLGVLRLPTTLAVRMKASICSRVWGPWACSRTWGAWAASGEARLTLRARTARYFRMPRVYHKATT